MNYMKKRWSVLVASCLVNLCIGALYAWSVFASPMVEHINRIQGLAGDGAITVGSISIVFSIANMVGPITMIGGGKLVRIIGTKKVILLGGIGFGLGLILCGFATNVAMLIIGFGLCCGLSMGMAYGCTISNCVKFFLDKRGFAGGLTTASYGLSSVVVPLIASIIIEEMDVTSAFKILGIAIVLIVSVSSVFILPCPDGFVPDGYAQKQGDAVTSVKDYTWREMLQTPIFYVMIMMLCCGAFMGMMMISQASPIAQRQIHINTTGAAVVVSVLALFNTGGRILGGVISDKIGQIKTLVILLLCSIIGLFLLSVSKEGSLVSFYAGICIIGICFGGFMGIYPGFTNERFGAKYAGINYGIMFIGFAIAGFFAPMMIGTLFIATGSYIPAYFVAMALSVLGLVLTFVYSRLA